MTNTLNPSEAVYGFTAWLASRNSKIVMSASNDVAPVADLVLQFCEANNLPEVSEQWPGNLIHPSGEVAVPDEKIEGRKGSEDKLDYSSVPLETLGGVVRVFEKGSVKYDGERTWMPGIPFSKLFSAALRHIIDWYYFGKNKDEESGEHPLSHVIANCMMLLSYIEDERFDDRKSSKKAPINYNFASKERIAEEDASKEYHKL